MTCSFNTHKFNIWTAEVRPFFLLIEVYIFINWSLMEGGMNKEILATRLVTSFKWKLLSL